MKLVLYKMFFFVETKDFLSLQNQNYLSIVKENELICSWYLEKREKMFSSLLFLKMV
jgi:hypothetical protein